MPVNASESINQAEILRQIRFQQNIAPQINQTVTPVNPVTTQDGSAVELKQTPADLNQKPSASSQPTFTQNDIDLSLAMAQRFQSITDGYNYQNQQQATPQQVELLDNQRFNQPQVNLNQQSGSQQYAQNQASQLLQQMTAQSDAVVINEATKNVKQTSNIRTENQNLNNNGFAIDPGINAPIANLQPAQSFARIWTTTIRLAA